MSGVEEKRVFPRKSVTLTAHCRIGNRYVRDAVADLSEGGLYLKTTHEPAKAGVEVRVALALPSSNGPQFCTLVGEVARIDRDARGAPKGLGVSFIGQQIDEADRTTLNGFIRATG